jgi:hypothetical protein
MHFRLLFPSDYVGAHDLNGKDVIMTIEKVDLEELRMEGNKKETKPVIWFVKAKKRMVLNKTNAKIVAKIHGKDTADWNGKQITLYPTTTKVGLETQDCIRVRPAAKGDA